MSNPTTMNGLGATDVSLTGLGGFMSAVGSFANARNQKAVATSNAAYSNYAAEDAAYRGQLELEKVQRAGAAVKGAQRARMGAANLDMTVGSPLEALTDTDYFNALDQNTVKNNTAKEMYGFRTQATNYSNAAKSFNPWLEAGASGLATAGQVASKWYTYNKAGAKPFGK